jgi:hypothetical protein
VTEAQLAEREQRLLTALLALDTAGPHDLDRLVGDVAALAAEARAAGRRAAALRVAVERAAYIFSGLEREARADPHRFARLTFTAAGELRAEMRRALKATRMDG